MERQSTWRHWTAAEDAAIRRSAVVGYPTLRALADGSGRTYVAVRTRASRLRAIRLPRLDPAERAARRPTEIPVAVLRRRVPTARRGALLRRRVPRPLPGASVRAAGVTLKDLRCSRCAVDGKRSDWPGRAG